jgi:hypothetical protein
MLGLRSKGNRCANSEGEVIRHLWSADDPNEYIIHQIMVGVS